jgi:hypothetical protein
MKMKFNFIVLITCLFGFSSSKSIGYKFINAKAYRSTCDTIYIGFENLILVKGKENFSVQVEGCLSKIKNDSIFLNPTSPDTVKIKILKNKIVVDSNLYVVKRISNPISAFGYQKVLEEFVRKDSILRNPTVKILLDGFKYKYKIPIISSQIKIKGETFSFVGNKISNSALNKIKGLKSGEKICITKIVFKSFGQERSLIWDQCFIVK